MAVRSAYRNASESLAHPSESRGDHAKHLTRIRHAVALCGVLSCYDDLFNWYMGCCATLLMSQLPFRLLLGTTCVLAYTSGWYEKVFPATNVVLLVFVAAITALWSSMSEAEG